MTDPQAKTLLRSDRLSRDFISVGVEDSVALALEKIRGTPGTGEIFYCYACDPEGKLVGVVPVRKLLRADPTDKIGALMFTRVVKLPIDATDELVEDFFVTYRFLAFPVVDENERIVGVVEVNQFVDAYEDVLDEDVEGRVRDEVFRFVGLPENELEGEQSVPRKAFRRFPWLLVNIAGGFLAATITRIFEHSIDQVVIVASFIPMVLVLSESLGVQTTAVSAAMLHEGKMRWGLLGKEVLATALAGTMAAAVVASLGSFYAWKTLFPLALFFGVACSTGFAAAFGAVLPLAFRRFKVDPHLASAPLVLATSDNLTLLVYFSLCSWLL